MKLNVSSGSSVLNVATVPLNELFSASARFPTESDVTVAMAGVAPPNHTQIVAAKIANSMRPILGTLSPTSGNTRSSSTSPATHLRKGDRRAPHGAR
jgi:hypothetical protein